MTISGLGPPSVSRTSWGVRFFDYDNDGLLDLMTASGDVFVIEALVRKLLKGFTVVMKDGV